jgi:Fungal fucose-specific lectin
MAQDNPNFPTGTASVSWLDSGGQIHLRVYSTDSYNVTERCWDGNGWTNGGFTAAGSAVSATAWQTQAGAFIRVYCTFEDKTVEYCWDGGGSGWYVGAYSTD